MTSEPQIPNVLPGAVVRGQRLSKPVEVFTAIRMGESIKLVGKGLRTGKVDDPTASADQHAQLTVTSSTEPFDGDAVRFQLGIEAERVALAYAFYSYSSLSIARVDQLPHQLEAIYHYVLALLPIRYVLTDAPGRRLPGELGQSDVLAVAGGERGRLRDAR